MIDTDKIIEEKEDSMHGTTATITVEVHDDGGLSKEERIELAISLLEHGTNADFVDWDSDFAAPTVNNRVI